MKRFPNSSNERVGSQQASPRTSPAPRPMSLVVQVDPPSKLTASNIPALSPASRCPTFVTMTMLLGLVGLTAIASSDSLRFRWLTSIFAGPRAEPALAGTNGSHARTKASGHMHRARNRRFIFVPLETEAATGQV